MAGITIRPATPADLDDIARIQAHSPEAAQWLPGDYLAHDCVVALAGGKVVGFAVGRGLAAAESEILTLAVAPYMRHCGVGRALVKFLLTLYRGDTFLEVRESNRAARDFYEALGFQAIAVRPQ